MRGQVFHHIKLNPGVTFTELLRAIGVSNGALVYHLYALDRAEFVRSEKDGKWRRYYLKDLPAGEGGGMISAVQRRMLDLVKAQPGMSQSELARRLGTKPQNVHYNLSRLRESGLVRMERVGWSQRVYSEDEGIEPPTPAG